MDSEDKDDRPGDDRKRPDHGDDHGHGHRVTIIVNTREKVWTEKEISFEQVLALAFNPVPTGDNWSFTVGYRKGPGDRPEGSLTAGQSVKVKDGMVFSATATDKS